MPKFELDTSGEVTRVYGMPFAGQKAADVQWRDLDPFAQGYIEALFFTEEESLAEQCGEDGGAAPYSQSAVKGFSDLAPCALASIIADCEAFQRDNATTLAEAYTRDYDAEQAGRDYWFTRNGHGVGFWDRKELEPQGEEWEALQRPLDTWSPAESALHARLKAESLGERLSAACRYSEVSPYLGDDGKVYLS